MRQVIIFPGEDGYWVRRMPRITRLHQPGNDKAGSHCQH